LQLWWLQLQEVGLASRWWLLCNWIDWKRPWLGLTVVIGMEALRELMELRFTAWVSYGVVMAECKCLWPWGGMVKWVVMVILPWAGRLKWRLGWWMLDLVSIAEA
jgi:hypothetical protein